MLNTKYNTNIRYKCDVCTVVVSFTCKELQVWCWCVWPCRLGQAGHCCLCWLGQVVVLVPAQLSHCTAGLDSSAVQAQLFHCTAGLVGWCQMAQVELVLHCCCELGSEILFFTCFKTQLLLFHLVFQMLVVTDKMQMILLHSLFQICTFTISATGYKSLKN